MAEERKLSAFAIKSEVEPDASKTKKIGFFGQNFVETHMKILAERKGYPINSTFVGGIRYFILETAERKITSNFDLILGTGVVMQGRQSLNLAIVIRALSETSIDGYIEEEIQEIIKEISEYLVNYRKKWTAKEKDQAEFINYAKNWNTKSFIRALTKIYNEWDGSPKSETGNDIKLTIYK